MAALDVFAQFPRITTERLVLRQIVPDDAEALYATFSDEAVMKYYGDEAHQSLDNSRHLIHLQQEWYGRRAGIRWGITWHGEGSVIGSCGLFNFDEERRRAEVGYELRHAYWRQGIMREALTAILSLAFGPMALHRVEALTDGRNAASQGILTSLGFTHEGTLRQRFYFHGGYHDDWYFGLLSGDWPVSLSAAVNYTLVEITT
jgi:ribosomal-protein-alanine N-acetyltransferase